MEKTKIKAYGKINLYFELVNKRKDGYHNIKSIMQNIELYDEITLEETGNSIEIYSNLKDIPTDDRNTVYKAVDIIKNTYGIKKGIKIYINKNIPHGAGLGGGSSDSAAVIKALNHLWNLNLNKNTMHAIASKIGTDVHFFIEGGAAYVTGRGDQVRKIKNFNWNYILLVKPRISISTPYIYSLVELEDLSLNNENFIFELYQKNSEKEMLKYFKNDLEKIVFQEFEEVKNIKKTMLENKAKASLMSGSGSSVFGLFENEIDMVKCKKIMGKKYRNIYITKSIERGWDYER